MKHTRGELVWRILWFHGPMTDQTLVWWAGFFGMTPRRAKQLRYRLTREGRCELDRLLAGRRGGRKSYRMVWRAVV